jgi:hypothetical protein
VRRHRHDNQPVFLPFVSPDERSRLVSIHFGHLKIHQRQIEASRADEPQRLHTVPRNDHLMPAPLHKSAGHSLVDGIIFH